MSYSKDKLKQMALEYVNEVRFIFGKKPLKDLKKGIIQNGTCCTISKSIGMYPLTTGKDGCIEIFSENLKQGWSIERTRSSKLINVEVAGCLENPIKLKFKSVKHPKAIEQFISKFDSKAYPELIAPDYKKKGV